MYATSAVALAFAWFAGAARAVALDPGPPSIESVAVSHVTSKRATLEATIDPHQLETAYEFWVEYANCQNVPPGYAECESISVEKVGEGHIQAGPSGQSVSASFVNLQPEYTYDYWVVASNSMGESESAHKAFKALPAPTVDSESVSGQAPSPIELEAQIDPNGQAVYYQFQLVADPSEYAAEIECPESRPGPLSCVGTHVQDALPIGYLPSGCGPRSVSLDLSEAGVDLEVGSTYHYRAVVVPAVQTEDTIEWDRPPTLGADQSFTVGEDNVTPPPQTSPPTGGAGAGGTAAGGSGQPVAVSPWAPLDIARALPKAQTTQSTPGRGAHKKHRRHRSKASRHKHHRSKASRRGHRKQT